MPMRIWSHHSGGATLGFLRSALNAWFIFVGAGFALLLLRHALAGPTENLTTELRLDAVTLAAAVIAGATLFLRAHHDSLTRWRVLAVSVFWVALSITSERAYRFFIEERQAMRLLMAVLLGDSDPARALVWQTFLAAQMAALPALTILRDGLLRLRTNRIARQS